MTAISIGDLAQTLLQRRSITATRQIIDRSTADLATGQASDPGRHLGGYTLPLSDVQSSLARNEAQQGVLATAKIRTDVMQAALDRIDRVTADVTDTLLASSQAGMVPGLSVKGRQAIGALDSVVSALNQRSMDQSLFAGTATDGPALIPADAILAAAETATASAVSPTDIAAALDAWLSDPAGFATAAGRGNADPTEVPAGQGQSIRLDVSALDPGFRSTFKGLILGALMTTPRFSGDTAGQADLARLAGQSLLSAAQSRTEVAARLGVAQARIAEASTRLSAESSALGMARNDLLSVDMYEVSSRLTEAETRLKTLYALTARLSSLNLADYLR